MFLKNITINENEKGKRNEKGDFLKLLNKEGFLLELKTQFVLDNFNYRNRVWNKTFYWNERNYEVDAIERIGNYNLIIECKKTSYSWVFSKSVESINITNILSFRKEKLYFVDDPVRVGSVPDDKDAFGDDYKTYVFTTSLDKMKLVDKILAVEFEVEYNPHYKNSHNSFLDIQNSRTDINDAINQVLINVEGVCNFFNYFNEDVNLDNSLIVPLIITNAKLLILNFSEKNINKNIDLEEKDIVYEEVGYLGVNSNKVIHLPMFYPLSPKDKYQNNDLKTVFIVNIAYLKDFIENFMNIISMEYEAKSKREEE